MSGRRTVRWLGVWLLALASIGAGAPAGTRGAPPRRDAAAAADMVALARAQGPEGAPTRVLDGEVVIGANDLARLLDATKFWRADVRKLVLRTHDHRILLTADNPFVLVDDATLRLPSPVRSFKGELQVPVALVDSLPRDSLIARLLFDPSRRVVLQVPPGGVVGAPRLALEDGGTRLVFAVDRPGGAWIAARSRAHFRVHFSGFFAGALPDTLPEASLVRAVRLLPSVAGSVFEFELSPRAAGFRLVREPAAGQVALVFTDREREDFEAFAPEGPPGPRALKVVVLDPGHGGSEAGAAAAGLVEKDLTLSLARVLKIEIERRLAVRVVLTREDDRDLSLDQRAERANRARADLVLSLHFDGFTGPGARGATAYCPPATFGSSLASERMAPSGAIAVLPWRDVATRHAVRSRELAEDLLSSLDLRGQGPTRLREILPCPLLGVNAPGLMLECATLTSDADRERLQREGALNELAASIVEGIEAYRRGE